MIKLQNSSRFYGVFTESSVCILILNQYMYNWVQRMLRLAD